MHVQVKALPAGPSKTEKMRDVINSSFVRVGDKLQMATGEEPIFKERWGFHAYM